MSSSALSAPLPRRGIVLADLVPGALVRDVLLVVGGAVLMGITAQVAIPLPGTPVPLTLGTFAVLTLGAAYGWERAAMTILLYVGAGIAGVPWFAQGTSGFGFPSSGYLLGYLAAAVMIGALAKRGLDRSPAQTAGAMVLGNAVIYAFGVPYLAWSLDLGVGQALMMGMVPFLVGDAIKVAAAAGLLPLTWRLMDRLHRG